MKINKLVQKALAAIMSAPSLFIKKQADEAAKTPNVDGLARYLGYIDAVAESNRGFRYGAMAPRRATRKGNPLGYRHQGVKECSRRIAAA